MSEPQLQRKLGLWSCISIVAGSVIGSSIFMKPATMAGQLGSPVLLLLVWVVAGVVSMFGGMINAELGAALPRTGGQYVYFRHMYGGFFAYLYGWAGLIVINTASIAGIAFVFAQYAEFFGRLPRLAPEVEKSFHAPIPFLGNFYPLENLGVKGLAILLILAATLVNIRSLRAGAFVQVLFTGLKVGALLVLVGAIGLSGRGNLANLTAHSATFDPAFWPMLFGFVAATTGALAAYDGWNNLGFVAGEIKDPQRNIPRGLFIGIGICLALYVLTTEAYLYMLPVDRMKHSPLVASDALQLVIGAGGAGLIALLVMVSSAGATNGSVLPCARITYAMAAEGQFFPWSGRVHPRFFTPANALWLQGLWTCLLILIGSFDMLMDMFVFVTWCFYFFAAYGIFIIRRKIPAADRPYRMWGYPVLPVIFMAFAGLYLGLTLYADVTNYLAGRTPVINSALGLLLTATGLPVYWLLQRMRAPAGI